MAEKFTDKSEIEQLAALAKMENYYDKLESQTRSTYLLVQRKENKANDIAQTTPDTLGNKDGTNAQIVLLDNAKIDLLLQKQRNQEFFDNIVGNPSKSYYDVPRVVAARERTIALNQSIDQRIAELNAKTDALGPIQQDVPEPQPTGTQDSASNQIESTNANQENFEGDQVTDAERRAIDIAAGATGDPTAPVDLVNDRLDNAAPDAPGPNTGTIQLTTPEIDVTANHIVSEPDNAKSALSNVLHEYASYTYSLSIHLLDQEEYNEKIVKKPNTWTPKRVLVASAGRKDAKTFNRSPYFKEDFYFEDLVLDTVIAPNESSRNTNAISGSMTLIEPYGMTLVNRLIEASQAPDVNSKNYLDNPYLLQIEFFAIGDDGEIKGSIGKPKRIPFKIVKFDIKAGSKGAEYKIEFVPFNHSAFAMSYVTTPANFEIVAKNPQEFFLSESKEEQLTNGTTEREVIKTSPFGTTETVVNNPLLQSGGFDRVRSYGSAINAWNKELLKTNKIKVRDVYAFKFDPIIADSPFVDIKTNNPKDTRMSDTDGITSRKGNLGSSMREYDSTLRLFQINAGTSIEKVINYVVRNTRYIQEQLATPEEGDFKTKKEAYKDEPLRWFKIVPTVELIEYDKVTKLWARKITYHVKPYDIYNVRSDVAPQGVAKNPVKSYNYIYTGKNTDIIDFDIQFNALYFTAITALRDNLAKVNAMADSDEEDYKSDNSDEYQGSVEDPNAVMPSHLRAQVADSRSVATGGSKTTKQIAIADLEQSLMTASQADMLNVKLKIIGDPHFIKQDDVYYSPVSDYDDSSYNSSDLRLTANDSIRTDDGEIYAQLLFRTPMDINEETGIMDFNSKYQLSVFSGLYKVLMVRNEFSKGMFTQVLDLVRLTRQPKYDYVNKTATQTQERQESLPGVGGVIDNYDIGPVYDVGGTPDTSTAEVVDSEVTTAPLEEEAPIQETDLTNIVDNAEEEPMTDQNEPVTVPPFNTAFNPFQGLPAGGTAADQNAGVNNLFGQ